MNAASVVNEAIILKNKVATVSVCARRLLPLAHQTPAHHPRSIPEFLREHLTVAKPCYACAPSGGPTHSAPLLAGIQRRGARATEIVPLRPRLVHRNPVGCHCLRKGRCCSVLL